MIFSKTRMMESLMKLADDVFNQALLQYLTLNNSGLHSLILDYCDNITDASIISISENCTGLKILNAIQVNITDAYLSYELSFCPSIHPFRSDEYIKMNHSLNTIRSKNNNIHVVLSQLECYLLLITYSSATKAS